MKVLLDTHVVIWWLEGSSKLSKRALGVLTNPKETILVSAATAWELAIKVNLGKFNSLFPVSELSSEIEQEGFVEMPIGLDHAVRAGLLPLYHRDPFDRLLVAQAQALSVPILSADELLDLYDVNRMW
jgi:PIN domain nuclease of toxin-antitoxin system